MADDGLEFTTDHYRKTFEHITGFVDKHWNLDKKRFEENLELKRKEFMDEGFAKIRETAGDLTEIHRLEGELKDRVESNLQEMRKEFENTYLVKMLISSPDRIVREVASDLADEKHKLSKIHTKYSAIETERDKLKDLVPMAYYNLQEAIIETLIKEILEQIREECKATPRNDNLIVELMRKHAEYNEMKKELARYLGERIIAPRIR